MSFNAGPMIACRTAVLTAGSASTFACELARIGLWNNFKAFPWCESKTVLAHYLRKQARPAAKVL